MRKRVPATCLTILTLLLLVQTAQAQQASKFRVDGERMKGYIEYLSTDEMEGRQTMTEGYRISADWVASKFKEWGLEPAGENGTYFQKVPISRGLTWNTGVPELSINGKAYSLQERDFTINSISSPGTRISADVVFVGYGISAPDKGLDEYAGINVRGKVVLALRGSPANAPQPRRGGSMAPAPSEEPAPEEEWTEESTDNAKIEMAYSKGAAAILLYDPDEAAQTSTARMGMGRRGGESAFEAERNFLAFIITGRIFNDIMRESSQESNGGITRRLNNMRLAIKYLKPCSIGTGATARLKGYDKTEIYSEELGNNFGRNVIGKIVGTDRRLRTQYVIMGGHLDHLGIRNGLVYNGADDNASGTAVVMEVARVLKEGNFRPRRTIIFCGWCGEEMGLIGSRYYTENPCDGVTMDNVVTYFNMDMVGLGNAIGAPGALNFPTIWEVIKRDQDEDVIAAVRPRTGGPGGSDHSGFIEKGIEAMALMTSGGVGHPDYHQPEDDTEKIDPEILRKTGQFVIQGTMNLANERSVNLLIENRQDIYNAVMLRITSFNPGAEGSAYRYVEVNARNKDDLIKVVLDSALAIATRPTEQTSSAAAMQAMMRAGVTPPARSRKSFNRGLRDLQVFQGDSALLVTSAEILGFGRVDVESDDGTWFRGGRLTGSGRQVLKVMEENNITIHLVSPSESLINDMLSAATKPFLITGNYTVNAAMADAINEKNILLGVTMNPADVKTCISDLEKMKALLGDTNNLFLCVTTNEGMDEAQKALYMGLREKGWTHLDIAGDRREGGGITGGNLSSLTRGAMRFARR